jgi:hypothetical protein
MCGVAKPRPGSWQEFLDARATFPNVLIVTISEGWLAMMKIWSSLSLFI